MVIYDKGKWQLEGGVSEQAVIDHFKFMFSWLKDHEYLNEYGVKSMDEGIDRFCILSEEMLNKSGNEFMSKYYDAYIGGINYGIKENAQILDGFLKEK